MSVRVALAPIVLFIMLPLLGCDPCGNEVVQSSTSPDKLFKAILFQRDCGATTGFSSQISIVAADSELPADGGNVFIADLKGDGPTGRWGGPLVSMRWSRPHRLEIRYDHTARTFQKAAKVEDVAVDFVVH